MAVCSGILVAPLMDGESTDQGANLAGAGGQFAFEVGDTFSDSTVELIHDAHSARYLGSYPSGGGVASCSIWAIAASISARVTPVPA